MVGGALVGKVPSAAVFEPFQVKPVAFPGAAAETAPLPAHWAVNTRGGVSGGAIPTLGEKTLLDGPVIKRHVDHDVKSAAFGGFHQFSRGTCWLGRGGNQILYEPIIFRTKMIGASNKVIREAI